ncbi:MAG: hypothetical protein ISS29_05010 [Candidatus Marinimicrobia bacterium]|nr:hypothetical protein [Candidatus Neomarinimicrobiota bacterium]
MSNIKKDRLEGFPSKETPALQNIVPKIYFVIKEVQKTFVFNLYLQIINNINKGEAIS